MNNYALGLIMLALAALLYQPGNTELERKINSASNAAVAAVLVVCAVVMLWKGAA